MKKAVALFIVILMSLTILGPQAKAQPTVVPQINLQEQNTMSVLWFQKSGEARALYYQGYNIGKMRLDEILKSEKKGSKPAVVLDIDETIIDNSPFLAWNINTGKPFDDNWDKWVKKAQSKVLPGALEFLKYADSKGVAIFYISNRKELQKSATIKELKQIGAPQVNSNRVLLQQPGERGKEARRAKVASAYQIVLLFGDNLNDFIGFDGLSVSGRIQTVDQLQEEFGKKFIVFPNPMYGDWEGAIYNFDQSKSDIEKAKLRKENLEIFQP